MVKQLLVRGDDLGYSEAVTLGMISAHRKGIVNSVALMVNMPYAKEAIALAKQCHDLCLGLHVNVTNGKALAPKELIPSLVDEQGVFLSSTVRRNQLKNNEPLFTEEEAYIEAKYQIEKYLELVGKLPEYIDLHVLEVTPLINAIVRIYHEYNVPVCYYCMDLAPEAAAQAMKQYDYYQEHDCDFERMFIDGDFRMNEGLNILVTHPGFIDYDLAVTSSMLQERLYDYSLVTSPRLKQWLSDNEIEVISFRDLK